MKVKPSELKSVNVAYLYDDGHLVLVHEKRDKHAGTVSWVTIYQNVGIKTYYKGRLIIDKGALPFVLHSTAIEAKAANISGGSENTKRLGISVETIILRNGISDSGFIISNFPDIISSDIKYQENVTESFADVRESYSWAFHNVSKVYAE